MADSGFSYSPIHVIIPCTETQHILIMESENTKNRIADKLQIRFVKIVIKNGLCQFLQLKNFVLSYEVYSIITFLTMTC